MEDITIRAINTLKMVEVIFCEDTRVTGLLMKHFDIKKRLVANHEHNEEKNKNLVKNLLEEGKSIGLVSDRGTPVISDPGFEIAKYVIELGYNVIPLPGATALIPALIASAAEDQYLDWYFTEVEKGVYKRCSKCGQVKLAIPKYFSRNKTSKDGWYSVCKSCRNKNG